ncbi:MAG: stage II sporulation protein P [Lachnospiraceae bacterium]
MGLFEKRTGRMRWLFEAGIIFLLMLLCIYLSIESGKLFFSNQGREVLEMGGKDAIRFWVRFSFDELSPLSSYMENGELGVLTYLEQAQKMINREIIPGFTYVEDYWGDADKLVRGDDSIPRYFLEAGDEQTKSLSEKETMMEKEKIEPIVYTKNQLNNFQFMIENIYQVDITTKAKAEELNGEKLLGMDMSIDTSGDEPKILIYHTHGSEAYKDSEEGNWEDTVIGVGEKLKEILEKNYKIAVYHDETIYDKVNGELDRSKAYTYAGEGIEKILEKYPSIEVVIDLHRDSVGENLHLVTKINGKSTAKIMFFNGMSRTAKNGDIAYLYNKNKEANLAFSLQLQLVAAKKYPDFTRKIYLKGYRYNLHLKPRSLLIEVGAENNTVEEAKNAMAPLADLLNDVLSGKLS